ncbi:MAG: hypothetical protein IKA77_04670 [Clostridia bacterium]|nr:hypothetical protein [Clostridia bacterium]
MKKTVSRTIVVISIILTISILFSYVLNMFFGKNDTVGESLTPFECGERPEGEALALTMPDPADEEAVIKFAADLYAIASEKWCTAPNAAYMIEYRNTMMGIDVRGNRYQVRNGDQERYLEYAFIDNKDPNDGTLQFLIGLMGAIAGDSTRFAEARYTDASMDYIQSYKFVGTSDEDAPKRIEKEEGGYTYEVNWEAGKKGTLEKHNYGYRLTDHDITAETIKTAEVAYNAEEGYYTLNLVLDCDLAPAAITLPNLRASGAGDNAVYTQLIQEITIWDNGYPRSFLAKDKYQGTLAADLEFDTKYYFEEYWTNIENYENMAEYCQLMD